MIIAKTDKDEIIVFKVEVSLVNVKINIVIIEIKEISTIFLFILMPSVIFLNYIQK